MKQFKLFFTLLSFIVVTATIAQPSIGTTLFSTSSNVNVVANSTCTVPKTYTLQGWAFTVSTAGQCGFNWNGNGGTFEGSVIFTTVSGNWNYGIIQSNDGSEFNLQNLNCGSTSSSWTGVSAIFVGYKNGSAVSGATLTSAPLAAGNLTITNTVNFTGNSSFNNIDEVRVYPSSSVIGSWALMDITIGNAVASCPTPTLTTVGQTSVSCYGGSTGTATVSASGGAPFTYAWTPNVSNTITATGLTAQVYTCVTTNSCGLTASTTVNITQPASALATSTAVTGALCNGGNGSATVTATGGTSAYTYSWSTGATTSTITAFAGIYTVKATDANGCVMNNTVTIIHPSAVTTNTGYTNVFCYGGVGSATIIASGGTSPYTYTWSSGATGTVAINLTAGSYTTRATDANGCASATKTVNISQPPLLVTNTTAINPICNGGTGSATVTATGGTTIAPYSYTWQSGSTTSTTTLSPGTYTVKVTDINNCTNTNTVTIVNPPPLLTPTAVTGALCNGGNGSATITATGGTGAYTYSWSNGATTSTISGVNSGVYTATVTDASSCSKTTSVNITQPTVVSANVIASSILCNGGISTVTVSATGGTGAYTGTGTFTATAGIKTYTITDANSCSTTASVNITQPTILSANAVASSILCNGGVSSVTVSATGGTGAYTGTGTFTATAGIKTYTITDANSCSTTASVNITQPTALSTSTAVTGALCNGGNGSATVTATGGTGAYTYSWSTSATTSVIATTSGVKTVTVTDANGCKSINNANIGQPTVISANAVASSILCNGGMSTVTVTATGGTTAYTGVGTFTALAGTKTYTVTDANSCSTTASVTISQPTTLSANAVASSILCNGGVSTVTVTATGGTTAYTGVGTFTTLAGTKTYTVTDANSCSTTASVNITQPTVVSANAVASSILCNGGISTVTVSATGGTTAYTGIGTFTALAGTQTYTITDANSCATTASVTISQPIALSANAAASSILCNSGISTVTVSATGGTTAYAGVGTFTALAGTETYTITDGNSCSTTTSVSISEPTVLTANATASSILCNGGVSTVTVSATGGTPSYTGTGIFSVSAGNYTYTVTDNNGCSATTSVSVTEPVAIVGSQTITLCSGQSVMVGSNTYTAAGTYTDVLVAQNTCDSTVTTNVIINNLPTISVNSGTICAGQSFTIIPTGADTYTYSGGADVVSPASDATYSVSGTDANGCVSDIDAISSVTVNALPTLTATTSSSLLCSGETATLSVSGATSYTWSTTETTTDISVTPTAQTTYTVDGSDNNGCTNTTTITQDVNVCTGITSVNSSDITINVYPNPNNGIFYIELTTDSKVSIANALGQTIVNDTMSVGKHELDIRNQADGIYFVKVIQNNKQQIIKIIKK